MGWAEVHPRPAGRGLDLPGVLVWDKGLAHVAGNTNTKTLRKFPIVTEVCVHYVREPQFRLIADGPSLSAQQWLRAEWRRTGLSFAKANEACGVKIAATRKYLTGDCLWYSPAAGCVPTTGGTRQRDGDPRGARTFRLTAKPAWRLRSGSAFVESSTVKSA